MKKNLNRIAKKDRADVLLVYPIWVTSAGRGRLQRMLPPLGILSIASYLEQNWFEVHVVDVHAEKLLPDEFRQIVRSLKPHFVGITVLSSHFIPANHIAYLCKQEVPDCKVFAGGVHAECSPEQMLQNVCIDAVCRGDGEETMLELVQNKPYAQILGLSYRCDQGGVVHNLPRPEQEDLDQYPFPAYHLINLKNYVPAIGTYRDLPAVNMLMTKGCPGKCTFCNSAKTKLRGHSVDKMVELIKKLTQEYGIRQITFYDDTFTANVRTVHEFCNKLISEKIRISFVCYIRGDMFSEKTAELLSKAGCHQVLLGIESGSPALCEDIQKPILKDNYFKAVRLAHRYGMEVRASFIIGHLEETKESLRQTLQFAIDLGVDFLQPCVMTPYPGTELYRRAKQENLLKHEYYEYYGQNEPILKMKYLTDPDLMWFQTFCFFRFYFRPKAIWQQIKRLKRWYLAVDLLKAFYIILIEGISSQRTGQMKAWHDFDLNIVRDHRIRVPESSRLTWQARTESMES